MSLGTPNTLAAAIVRGLVTAKTVCMSLEEADALAREVEKNVRDFLAQRFCTAILKHDGMGVSGPMSELFTEITGKKVRV